jgi:hypothetical protein
MQLTEMDRMLDDMTASMFSLGSRLTGDAQHLNKNLQVALDGVSRMKEASKPPKPRVAGPTARPQAPKPPPFGVYSAHAANTCGQNVELLADCRPAGRTLEADARLSFMDHLYDSYVRPDRRNASELFRQQIRNQKALELIDAASSLSYESCRAMLHDPDHQFASMWGTPRVKMRPLCAPPADKLLKWAADMDAAAMCDRNWYEGVAGCHTQGRLPYYGKPVPALLGFDQNIIKACNFMNGCGQSYAVSGPQACIRANMSILALYASAPSYNMCRNLEWLVCAAKGNLVEQRGSATMVFTPAPLRLNAMELVRDSSKSAHDYSMKSVYVLETCILSQLCSNAEELFRVHTLQTFVCKYNASALPELVIKLLSPQR